VTSAGIQGCVQLGVINVLVMHDAETGDECIPMGEVNIEKRRGPRTEPWGTPVVWITVLDLQIPIETKLLRSARYDANHRLVWPVKPNKSSASCNNCSWFKVSNAALISNNNNCDAEPESTLTSKSLTTLVIAVSVVWNALYADYNGP